MVQCQQFSDVRKKLKGIIQDMQFLRSNRDPASILLMEPGKATNHLADRCIAWQNDESPVSVFPHWVGWLFVELRVPALISYHTSFWPVGGYADSAVLKLPPEGGLRMPLLPFHSSRHSVRRRNWPDENAGSTDCAAGVLTNSLNSYGGRVMIASSFKQAVPSSAEGLLSFGGKFIETS